MGEAGGMLTGPVLNAVRQQITSAIGNQITLQLNFNKDLDGMKMTLKSLAAVLTDAERQSIKDEAVRLWLRRLKNAMYDISDMIDEFEAEMKGTVKPAAKPESFTERWLLGGSCAATIQFLTVSSKIKLANKMKAVREELQEIVDQRDRFIFNIVHTDYEHKINDVRETDSSNNTLILGRTEEKQIIMDSLSQSVNHGITILPIYGIGGIGKTTFAKIVFNDTQFNDYSQVWVHVSQIFNLKKIGNSIIRQLSGEQSELSEMQMIHNRLKYLLVERKKTLLVLDDLWEDNPFQLKDLVCMLKVSEYSRVIIIVTTRDEGIAKKISAKNTIGPYGSVTNIEPYKLTPLTNDMCWTIIKQNSAFESRDDKEKLEQIGRDIAMKCGGVALAAQFLGHMLQSMAYHEWESVRDSGLWNNISTLEDTTWKHHNMVLSSLRLSYSNMRPSYLKLCFAYCALFPKGHKMVKGDLVRQWDSLGFMDASSDISSKRQLSELYIMQLLALSFLQHSKTSLTAGVHNDDDVTLLSMHDLVHDLAKLVMADEILDCSVQCKTNERSSRYALLNDCSKPLGLYTNFPAKIRALRFFDCGKMVLHDDAFSSAKYLRVLDLSECCIQKLPDSIGHLKQLRYLNAPGVQHETIPDCITKLQKLMYLILRGSSAILALPESIGEMEDLLYLDLSGCSGIEKLPGSFGKLKKLVHLDLSHCYHVTGVSESFTSLTNLQYLNLSYCPNIGKLPEALGNLSKLEYLNLSSCSYIKGRLEAETLGILINLKYLNLSLGFSDMKRLPEALSSFSNLKYLNLSGFEELEELPTSFGNIKSLTHLDLSHCHQVNNIPEALDGLTELQFLNLSHCCNIFEPNMHIKMAEAIGNLGNLQYLNLSGLLIGNQKNLGFFKCISKLSNLEHLDLSNNKFLTSLPDCMDSLRKLHTLDLSGCTYLTMLPASIGEIDSLRLINVNGCRYLTKELPEVKQYSIRILPFEIQVGDGTRSNLVLLKHVDPIVLEISNLENLRSVKEIRMLKLMERQRIKQLKLEWTGDVERFVKDMEVLGELVPPKTLERFEIRGYNCAKFPAWLLGITIYAPNLVSISIKDLPKCISLPPFGQLPNLEELILVGMKSITKVDKELCGGPRPFPRLKRFVLIRMESLEVWNTMYSCGGARDFMFPNLCELVTIHCPRLRLTPCAPRAERWVIEESDGILSSWGEIKPDTGSSGSSPPVTSLYVCSCKAPLREWRLLRRLPHLSGLSIIDCNDLTISEEIIVALSSLQWLALETRNNQTLPYWLGHMASIKELAIKGFQVKASEHVTENLAMLQSLHLSNCKGMTELPQWLGHLTSLKKISISCCEDLIDLQESVGRLNSLEKLEISGCNGIRSLPEGIEKLAKLESVQITSCPELKRWCEIEDNKRKLAHVKEMVI